MKELNLRRLLVYGLGALLARGVFIGAPMGAVPIGIATMGVTIAPAGVAYFAAVYKEKSNRFLILIATILGMLSVLPILETIKYSMVLIVTMAITSLVEHGQKNISILHLALLSGINTTLISASSGLLEMNPKYFYLIIILEGIVVFALTIIFYKGVESLLHGERGQALANEQIISLVIIFALCIYGLPSFENIGISLSTTISLLVVLLVGYKYGAGYGSLVGGASGIVLSMQSGQLNEIGLMCMLGIISGTFREFGRIFTIGIYSAGAILLGQMYYNNQFDIVGLSALLSSSIVFLLLPKSMIVRADKEEYEDNEEVFARQNIQSVARGKLREFSESFLNLSHTFYTISDKKTSLSKEDKGNIFNEISEQLCKNCSNCDLCWKSYFYETYHGANYILDVVEQNGTISIEDVPDSFLNRCISLDYYIAEARRVVEVAKINLFWHNKMAESREVIAGQLSEVASIIDDFSLDLYKVIPMTDAKRRQIIQELRSNQIIVNNIAIYEKRNNKQEIYLTCKMDKGKCITTKEAASLISRVIGKRFRPLDSCKNVISKELETFILAEDSNYKILTGMARMTKGGGRISGDNYSFLYPEPGTCVMMLSDGMGTGEDACEESESVVELLEQFIEAGFKKESAIKLINSIMVLKSEEQSFSTIDMSVINLYSGICDFIKIGASSTFIKRDNGVETINSSALPVGIVVPMDYESVTKYLHDGDYVIMVTDGVIDCIPGDEKEEFLGEFISELRMKNPKEIANAVLNQALELNGWVPKDDMTVLVAGFWKK